MAFSFKEVMGQLTSWSRDNVGSGALAMESEEQNRKKVSLSAKDKTLKSIEKFIAEA